MTFHEVEQFEKEFAEYIQNVRNELMELEKKLFFSRFVLFDSANIILDDGIDAYLRLLQQVIEHAPSQIIEKIDASARYVLRKKFGKEAFYVLNKLIEDKKIMCTPSKSECDTYLIQACIMNPGAVLITNDGFNDYNTFWTKAVQVVKYTKIGSRFYFNLDLKRTITRPKTRPVRNVSSYQEVSGLELLWDPNDTKGKIEIYPEGGEG